MAPARRRTILVVDDDPDLRAWVEHQLKQAGYDVLLAEDAASARARLDERVPDLILADIHMPQVSGVEFVAGLREDARLSGIPVVYLTALEADAELAVKTVGFPLLNKPVQGRELLALVGRQLKSNAT